MKGGGKISNSEYLKKIILWRYKHRQEKLFQDLELTNPNPNNLVCWHPHRGIIVILEANKH